MKSIRIGVLSDTHIPDRSPSLDADFISALKNAKVDLIFHLGDICVKRVLNELEQIAPVYAVRGNRDFLLANELPKVRELDYFGVKVALMHGHIDFITYWYDKFLYVFQGYRATRYISRLPKVLPNADVYVYGHSHHAENLAVEGKHYFNPGSVTIGDLPSFKRSWGILSIYEDKTIKGEILPLG